MNSKSKKKFTKIQIERFRKSQTNWPTIIKILNWNLNKNIKPDEEFHIEFRIEKEKPGS